MENTNSKIKLKKNILNNMVVIDPIYVSDEERYGVLNWLVKSNRIVWLKLIHVLFNGAKTMSEREEKIRAIIGMTEAFYKISKERAFRLNLTLQVGYRNNPLGGYAITEEFAGLKCVFTAPLASRTIFLEKPLPDKSFSSYGVYRWTIQISYADGEDSEFWFGGVPNRNNLSIVDGRSIAIEFPLVGRFSFTFCRFANGREGTSLTNDSVYDPISLIPVPHLSLVAMEVNISTPSISYFCNGRKLPFMFKRNILTKDLYLGVSAYNRPSFYSVSYCVLKQDTPSVVQACIM